MQLRNWILSNLVYAVSFLWPQNGRCYFPSYYVLSIRSFSVEIFSLKLLNGLFVRLSFSFSCTRFAHIICIQYSIYWMWTCAAVEDSSGKFIAGRIWWISRRQKISTELSAVFIAGENFVEDLRMTKIGHRAILFVLWIVLRASVFFFESWNAQNRANTSRANTSFFSVRTNLRGCTWNLCPAAFSEGFFVNKNEENEMKVDRLLNVTTYLSPYHKLQGRPTAQLLGSWFWDLDKSLQINCESNPAFFRQWASSFG